MLMLDNMAPEEMREVVDWIAGRVPVEASGRMGLEGVQAVARLGAALADARGDLFLRQAEFVHELPERGGFFQHIEVGALDAGQRGVLAP